MCGEVGSAPISTPGCRCLASAPVAAKPITARALVPSLLQRQGPLDITDLHTLPTQASTALPKTVVKEAGVEELCACLSMLTPLALLVDGQDLLNRMSTASSLKNGITWGRSEACSAERSIAYIREVHWCCSRRQLFSF